MYPLPKLRSFACLSSGHPFSAEEFGDSGVPVVRMSNFENRGLSLSNAHRVVPSKVPARAMAQPGDILVGLSGSVGELARVSIEDLPCAINQRIAIIRPTEKVDSSYLWWLVQSVGFVFQLKSNLTETTILNVSAGELAGCKLPLPPLATQTAIADYLDRKTAAIDALIAKKELLIEELRKYQDAVIAEAVAPREGWRAYKVKQLFSALPKSSLPSGVGTDDGPVKFYVSGEESKRVSEAMHTGTALLLADGGKATMHLAEGDFAWSDHVVCLTSEDCVTTEFVYNQLSVQRDRLNTNGFRGTGLPMLDKRWLYEELPVWLPESREESKRLNAEIRSIREIVLRLTAQAHNAVKELRSYRAALISEAVTGRLACAA